MTTSKTQAPNQLPEEVEKLIAELQSGVAITESWHELAARTNRERSRAANMIQSLAAENIELKSKMGHVDTMYFNLLAERDALQRQIEAGSLTSAS